MQRYLGLALAAVAGFALIACGSKSDDKKKEALKPGCKLLYKKYDECKTMPLTESSFVKMCEKLKDKPRTKLEIDCATKDGCEGFKTCLKEARKKGRIERMKKRWEKAMAKAKEGKWSSAMVFCDVWKKDFDDAMKKNCEGLAGKATAALMKDISAKRDKGTVNYKEIKCWDLKRVAKKAGAAQLKAAEALCKEVQIARDLKRARKEVDKQMKKERPYLPYQCGFKRLQEMEKLGTAYAKKVKGELIELCYKKLGKLIFEKKMPKMKYFCTVRGLYTGIQTLQIKDPELDKWMAKAKAKCEKKK